MNCENCGCKMYGGACVNCHEETLIFEQWQDVEDSECSQEFVDEVQKQLKQIKNK